MYEQSFGYTSFHWASKYICLRKVWPSHPHTWNPVGNTIWRLFVISYIALIPTIVAQNLNLWFGIVIDDDDDEWWWLVFITSLGMISSNNVHHSILKNEKKCILLINFIIKITPWKLNQNMFLPTLRWSSTSSSSKPHSIYSEVSFGVLLFAKPYLSDSFSHFKLHCLPSLRMCPTALKEIFTVGPTFYQG